MMRHDIGYCYQCGEIKFYRTEWECGDCFTDKERDFYFSVIDGSYYDKRLDDFGFEFDFPTHLIGG